MKQISIILTVSILILSGCGGDGGNSSKPAEENMTLDKTYTLYPGERIVKLTEDAELSIKHVANHKESEVKLVAGEAKIIRP